MMNFKLAPGLSPAGDQPNAISRLVTGIESEKKDQILLGVTGSGKTFTMANIIRETQKPALIMVHNKTLAAQLYNEMKNFFPENAVEYFISYYDYYQPEAYIATTDTYIEKDSAINDKIDQMRHSATKSILERRDVIIISSVSAIYGLGNPDEYSSMKIEIKKNKDIDLKDLTRGLVELQYNRNDISFERGSFMMKGDLLYIFPPSSENIAIRIDFFGNTPESIYEFDVISGEKLKELDFVNIYPNGHYVSPYQKVKDCVPKILEEMQERVEFFQNSGKYLEAQRIEQRVKYDCEMMLEIGMCKGIENYSRYLSGKNAGEPPTTLFDYFPKDGVVFADESHVTLPQIKAMYNGDRVRKQNLVDYGFRLPSALDNRPLKFEEWDRIRQQTIFVSATPGKIELEKTQGEVVEQIIRPTGLLDPICEIRPIESQVKDLIEEIKKAKSENLRTICITTTKKFSERLNDYFLEQGLKSMYLHADIEILDRIDIIRKLKKGTIDVVIGINLLREGIDIPECGLVAILDADKEGFLRSETSLIQIIGRAARNSLGKVILYADRMTDSMKKAITETQRRREIQQEFNIKNNITPKTTTNAMKNVFDEIIDDETLDPNLEHYRNMSEEDLKKEIEKLRKIMKKAAKKLNFDTATEMKLLITKLEKFL